MAGMETQRAVIAVVSARDRGADHAAAVPAPERALVAASRATSTLRGRRR
jgi:hypothetical protein